MNRFTMAGFLAIGCAGIVAAGSLSADAARRSPRRQYTKDLVVTLVTPTLNQEVLPDLADPGLNGRITVRFSSPPRRKDLIDDQNPVNRLTDKVEFLGSAFDLLPGEPTVRRNEFVFDPLAGEGRPVLPAGQYTLNIKSAVRNRRGRQLNQGLRDFTTTFCVGTDQHAPVLRTVAPLQGQTNVGLLQPIRATFNEPVDPSSLLAAITVQDLTTNPPTTIPGTVTVERNGFDVVFTPNPCFGYPPMTTIGFTMQGLDRPLTTNPDGSVTVGAPTTSGVTDAFGNGFRRDGGLHWTNDPAQGAQVFRSPNGTYDESAGIGRFRTEFRTAGTRPAPMAVSPGSPQFTATPFATPCAPIVFLPPSCYATGSAIHYTTSNGLGQFSMAGIINRLNQGVVDLSLGSVLANAPVRTGRPGGMVVDPRWDPATFHTYLYMVDQRTQTVNVLDSRNFQSLGRFSGFSAPRDVSISTTFGRNSTTLWVSDFASNQLVGVDLQALSVTFTGQPGAPSPCEQIADEAARRIVVDVGRGPTGVAADSLLDGRVMVTNTLDDSISIVNVQTGQVIEEYEVGSAPVDCDWTMVNLGAVQVAMVANQGGTNDPDGSISLYVGGIGRNGIENTFTDNVKNPSSVHGQQQWINGAGTAIPTRFIVPNTGGHTTTEYTFAVTGGFGVAISASPVQTYDVGLNPTNAVYDPFYPANFIAVAVAGQGGVSMIDYGRATQPVLNPVAGVQRLFTAYSH